MNKTIEKANEIVNSRANYIGGGMEGIAIIALIDESGYPTASVKTISRADGINWLTFNTSPDAEAVGRIKKNKKASVCIASSEYNISLKGTFEILTDEATKKDNWFEPMADMWSGPEDPNHYILRFNTEAYNIFIVDGEELLEDRGNL